MGEPTSMPTSSPSPNENWTGIVRSNRPSATVLPLAATVIAPPVRGDGWLANSGCCAPEAIHRAVRVPIGGTRIGKQEIFAIDFARLRDGEAFTGDGAQPEDWFGFDYYAYMPERNPQGPASGRYKSVRGGSWKSKSNMLRTATRGGAPPDQRSATIGFRCARSASP